MLYTSRRKRSRQGRRKVNKDEGAVAKNELGGMSPSSSVPQCTEICPQVTAQSLLSLIAHDIPSAFTFLSPPFVLLFVSALAIR